MIREIHARLPNNKDRVAVSDWLVNNLSGVNITFLSDQEFIISTTSSQGTIRSKLATKGFRFLPKVSTRYHSEQISGVEQPREFMTS